MTDKEIETHAFEKYPEHRKLNKKGTGNYDANYSRRKAFIEGFKECLYILMKESLDGEVRCSDDICDYIESEGFCASHKGLSRGDEVKIYIIKRD